MPTLVMNKKRAGLSARPVSWLHLRPPHWQCLGPESFVSFSIFHHGPHTAPGTRRGMKSFSRQRWPRKANLASKGVSVKQGDSASCSEEYRLGGCPRGQKKGKKHYKLGLVNTRTTINSMGFPDTLGQSLCYLCKPSVCQIESIRRLVAASMTISSGHGRRNPSLSHLRVASIPILEP